MTLSPKAHSIASVCAKQNAIHFLTRHNHLPRQARDRGNGSYGEGKGVRESVFLFVRYA